MDSVKNEKGQSRLGVKQLRNFEHVGGPAIYGFMEKRIALSIIRDGFGSYSLEQSYPYSWQREPN